MKKFLCLLISLTAISVTFGKALPERSEIPDEYKWNLASMYASQAAWQADVEKFKAMLPTLTNYKGRLGEGGSTLLEALQKIDEVQQVAENLYVYAGMKSFEDLRVGDNSANFSQAMGLLARLEETLAYFTPELLSLDPAHLDDMIASTPMLKAYRHAIDETLRLRAYTLSEPEEKILAAASEPLGKYQNIFTSLDNADLTFDDMLDEEGNPVELTKGRYGAFLYSPDRRVRQDAWTGLFEKYEQHGNMLAANYEGHVKARVFFARVRGYESALHSATYRSAIPQAVYLNLIEATRKGAPLLQKYLQLRRKILDLDTLEIWDMYAPIAEPTIHDVPWEEAKNIVADALKPLGEEYVNVYWRGFDEGWVDVYESKGKRGGAYSWGTYGSKPYLSMNYDDTLNSISTLAHEYGHSIHSYLANQTQPYIYADYRTFIAEVASMTNEALLYQKLLREAGSGKARIFLLQTYLDNFRGSFFRQTSFADYEMQAHALVESGQALAKDSLNKLYADVFATYYGDAVNAHPLNASEWSRIPHFLRNDNFYVYQYSTSFAAATALAKMIVDEGEPARERFLTMLKSGNSDYPIELLKKAGVDMTTSTPIEETIAIFGDLVAELEQELERL